MKVLQTFAIVLAGLGSCAPVHAEETLRPDAVIKGNWILTDSDDQGQKYLRKDPVIRGQYRIEDRNGKTIGWLRPDRLFKDRGRIEHERDD